MGYAQVSSDFYIRWHAPESTGGLEEEHLAWCLESMQHHGFDRTVFYDRGDFVTRADWLEFATAPERMFFCIFESTGRQVVAFWMDMPTATLRQSFIHFTLLVDPASVDCVAAIRQTAAWVFEHMSVRQLIGLTPACFRHAMRLVRAVGFTELARLEKAIFVRGRERDAILSVLGHKDLPAQEPGQERHSTRGLTRHTGPPLRRLLERQIRHMPKTTQRDNWKDPTSGRRAGEYRKRQWTGEPGA